MYVNTYVVSSDTLPVQKIIQETVKDLFLDLNIWPHQRSLFYLGILLPLLPLMFQNSPIHTHIANMCHTTSIRLTGQTWGIVCCSYFKTHSNFKTSPNHTTITLPAMLSCILPPSLSYPSFSISFS